MPNNAKKTPENPKKSFLDHDEGTKLVVRFNGTRVPLTVDKVTVDYEQKDGIDWVKQLDFWIKGESDLHLDIGELDRLYEDDPIVQRLLSYVVRAELLYVLERSWLAHRKREHQDDQRATKKRKKRVPDAS